MLGVVWTLKKCWISSVQLLIHVRLFATPWIAARQASLSITNSRSLLKLMPIESVMPSSHLILYRPLLLLPPIPPSIRVFSNESTFCMRWPKYWSFSFSISPSNEHPGLISFRMDWLDLLEDFPVNFTFNLPPEFLPWTSFYDTFFLLESRVVLRGRPMVSVQTVVTSPLGMKLLQQNCLR